MKKQTPIGEIEVFDSHLHFFSHNFFKILADQSPILKAESDPHAKISEMTGVQMPPENATELAKIWIAELDKNHISKGLFFASLPNDEDSIASAVKACPDRIYGGFFFNPLEENAVEKARKAFDENGLKVIGLFPAMHKYSVADNENVRKIAELVSQRKGTAIFVHCGALSVGIRKKLGLKSPFDLRFSNPFEVHKLASEFPDVNFIIPHFGAGFWRETMMAAELCSNIFIDTSSTNKWTNYEISAPDLKTVFEQTISLLGHERLLFGTDSSFFPRGWNGTIFDQQLNILREIGINHTAATAILGGNLSRLLNGSP